MMKIQRKTKIAHLSSQVRLLLLGEGAALNVSQNVAKKQVEWLWTHSSERVESLVLSDSDCIDESDALIIGEIDRAGTRLSEIAREYASEAYSDYDSCEYIDQVHIELERIVAISIIERVRQLVVADFELSGDSDKAEKVLADEALAMEFLLRKITQATELFYTQFCALSRVTG